MKVTGIHPTAIIDPKAELAADVRVGAYSIIGPDVKIDSGCEIGPHVVLQGPTTIGKNNRIFQFASIGEECQDKKYKGEPTTLVIGDGNTIREYCTFQRGTVQDKGTTIIGSNNWFMAYVHVGHDSTVGDNGVFANSVQMAGHVEVGNGVIIGALSGVHQFCKIGHYSMAGGGSIITKDIPAFVMVNGNPAAAHGMNYEGMRRRGWSPETINTLKKAYKVVYREGLTVEKALEELDALATGCPEVKLFADSIRASTRGITR
ncbi:MAG TPA: acyl-ACP--UDP-N-acetylglucosamine O-acyltransferase [Pseudomonadales bacterium]|nr:acyl-ACP--UDP-N-acetylglucosamine O-acyltransferase [Pseudomonadales bacterium]